jgi:hypothetical protein
MFNTVLDLVKRLGYKGDMTGHGFRALAMSTIKEKLGWRLRFFVTGDRPNTHSRLPFAHYVRNDDRAPRLVKLIATCGTLDMDDPKPAITVMLPDEN